MQKTSATFAPYCDARWSNMRVSFKLIDVDAAGDATAIGTGHKAALSQLGQMCDGNTGASKKWAALETDGWKLDGTHSIMPDSVAGLQTGFWSGISGADGTFATPPTLTFTFTANHSSVGFMLYFDDKAKLYPKVLTIAAYDASGTKLAEQSVTADGIKLVVDMMVTGYRKIVVTFHSTQKPYQSVRVTEVIFGIIQEFDRENMIEGDILYELAPKSDSLPYGQLTVTIDNSQHRYNMLSPNSLYAYLQQGQPLDAEIGVGATEAGLEYVSMGRFYFAKSEAADDSMTAKITAYDRIYQLDKGTYRKGVSGTATVSALVAAVLADAGIGLMASIPAAIGSRIIGSCIPLVSHREALRMIAQAARCVCYIDRAGVLVFADLATGTAVDALTKSNMPNYPTVSVSDRVNTADVSVFSLVNSASDKTETICRSTVTISGTQDVWIEFPEAVGSPVISVSGGTLNKGTAYLYSACLNITATGSVTITVTGYRMTSTETVYTSTNIQSGENVQPVKVQNKLVVNTDVAAAVAAWTLAFSRISYSINERGNPARELLDTASIEDTYGVNGNGVVTKETYKYDGTLSCQTEAVKL